MGNVGDSIRKTNGLEEKNASPITNTNLKDLGYVW